MRDRYSTNVFAESVSRVLNFFGALVSTIILWRSIAANLWTTDDYGIIKVLSNVNQAFLPIILLGVTGAVVRVTTEYSYQKDKIGRVIGFSVLIITTTTAVLSVVTILFGLDLAILGPSLDIYMDQMSIRFYWVLVLLTMLPTAYLRIAKSIFSGLQQFKKNTYVDIVYGIFRIGLLLFLFVFDLVNVLNIMLLNLALAFIAAGLALAQIHIQMRRAGISWAFLPNMEIVDKLGRLSMVSLAGMLALAVMNNVTVIWMSTYGTLTDVGLFSIAQGITLTARMLLGAPLAALVPNLTLEYELGRTEELNRKFREGWRAMVPTYAFAFAAIYAFATQVLRVLYGADSVGATGFLQMLAFNVLFVVTPGIYTNLYFAFNDIRAMLWSSILQVGIQILWVVVFTPLLGVIAIAMIWVIYIPFCILVHFYTKRKYGIYMETPRVVTTFILGLVFAGLMFYSGQLISPLIRFLHLPNIVDAMILSILAVPFWYLFMLVASVMRIVDKKDLANFEVILKIVPPAWWVSRPILERISRLAKEHEEIEVSS